MINLRIDLDRLLARTRVRRAEGGYRHIKVVDKIDAVRKVRSVTVECPLEYPGLSPTERRKMYEGLGMVADAFMEADVRAERAYRTRRVR